MQTHSDNDAFPPRRGTHADEFMRQLEARAEKMKTLEQSIITAGQDGEPFISRRSHNGFDVVHRPDDPQKILRISIGGGDHLPVAANYLVFRGDRRECIRLLEQALKALKDQPDD